ncbi:hypothetical protein FisN_24Hh038 [Fistulifera solaris]|uniref:Uncharacterized protein n=1 Tax=Fistulifera solaris TaxID=1519565 RepID=A0A1Z5JEM8_FISSO|nr:hypothetical protein FisN_24Hh038 [Fistulifera solaris]|eukprot:GAX12464.1 hypothetical protein FisN_24Hh038 [Fistulifera solaris]
MTHSLPRVPAFSILVCWSLLLVALSTPISAFVVTPSRSAHTTRRLAANTAPTLTEATTWNVRLVMRGDIENAIKHEKQHDKINNSSRWILSEDPNDRKDGLWVWGLFKEPLYPFLLLTLQTDDIPLPNNNGTDFVPAMQLYAQVNHRRDEGKVILEGKDLCWRQMETVRADPLGAATVDLYDNVVVGTIALQPKQL